MSSPTISVVPATIGLCLLGAAVYMQCEHAFVSGPFTSSDALQPTITVAEMAKLGVARISLGGHLARAAFAVTRRAARELKEHGTAQFAKEGMDYGELQKLMKS